MKKLVFIFFIISISIYSYDFRRLNWGMSKYDIRMKEGKIKKEKGLKDIYYKKSKVYNLNVNIIFIFKEDKLISGGYVFIDRYNRNNRKNYLNNYIKIKKYFIYKYGKCKLDKAIWLNDLFKNDSDRFMMALVFRHVYLKTVWETKNSKIIMMMHSDRQLNILHYIKFFRKEEKDETAKN